MDKKDLEPLNFQELRRVKGMIEELLAEKAEEARREYEEKASALASQYGFRPSGILGRPLGSKRKKSNGHTDTPPEASKP